ncbi:MAG: lysophospholipid acyltransferase family protein [Gammaproteobacteria bacterium]|nr:lysophospholipid acyltransferase family protein [Rhodocyclaceae bacterium]MBU3910702.1 lysophospholipid acyltransferase family protein [Gammaproteobacteria bacterium]MBU3988512.1 lysophospholipid acyltransferase family protein [Gammaproteobacteria bacterium]MBU4003411.1 lysophospholipid acyltransferase family protein [Gammaproteobacteria bacterium]MBU4021882.1 lysophospholipid acyltransferase family protein [Gammaproteobacteria bacterium]
MGFLFRLLSRLPLAALHNLGALAGWLAYLLSPTYRRHLRENTAQAGCESARGVAVAEAGKSLLELPKLWLRPQVEVVERVVKVSGWELVEAAWQAGRGILFLTPHLGCFEIAAQYYAKHRPITALYRRPKQAWLATIIENGRGGNVKLAPADLSGVRKLIKALRSGAAVGILPDQAPKEGEGVWTPFFGRPAYTMTLAARLAQAGATVIFAFGERLHYGAGYHLRLFEPTGDVTTPAGINREIERLVLMCPEQYLWGYNRYKGAPESEDQPDTGGQ